MDFRKNRKIINKAIKEGCRTMAELARYLRAAGFARAS